MEDELARAMAFLDDSTQEAFDNDPRVERLMELYRQAKWDPYKVLGVPSSSLQNTVKAAYRAKAWSNHPDRGGGTKRMEEINIAYGVICKERRWV